jgi:xylan 1,4-beta-xylosidase
MPSNGLWGALIVMGLCVTQAQCQGPQAALSIRIDVSHRLGEIRPVQDVDNGPLCDRGSIDLSRYYKALAVRNVRLHDVPWTYDNAQDINYVFPHWDASADDPKSYDFVQTDYYLNSIAPLNINMIFRLGYSAEYKTPIHHNHPPESYQKFADISAHIVWHYDQAWANGEKLGVKYWEVWNEPDNPGFWSGTPEDYDRLYEITAEAVKAVDPSLKVGGPALAARLGFLDQFLKYCHSHKVPLDFVSWHIYTQDPNEVSKRAEIIHEMMKRYGFDHAESILDEWNYGPSNWNTLFSDPVTTRKYFDSTQDGAGAAFDDAVLIKLQDVPVDIATFYTGTTEVWGMFTSSGAPQKPYYAFLAFRKMLDTPNRLFVDAPASNVITALAGLSGDGDMIRILISNRAAGPRRIELKLSGLPWSGSSQCKAEIVDDHHDLTIVDPEQVSSSASFEEEVGRQSVLLLTIQPSR